MVATRTEFQAIETCYYFTIVCRERKIDSFFQTGSTVSVELPGTNGNFELKKLVEKLSIHHRYLHCRKHLVRFHAASMMIATH